MYLLRAMHQLKERYPQEAAVAAWTQGVREVVHRHAGEAVIGWVAQDDQHRGVLLHPLGPVPGLDILSVMLSTPSSQGWRSSP